MAFIRNCMSYRSSMRFPPEKSGCAAKGLELWCDRLGIMGNKPMEKASFYMELYEKMAMPESAERNEGYGKEMDCVFMCRSYGDESGGLRKR